MRRLAKRSRALNLALEMGDNVMLYLDDIQHMQSRVAAEVHFTLRCDAKDRRCLQRQDTHLRSARSKVAVVMAGNPYTESGERFQIPDMLSNRADVYNLGEIIGDVARGVRDELSRKLLDQQPTLAPLGDRPAGRCSGRDPRRRTRHDGGTGIWKAICRAIRFARCST